MAVASLAHDEPAAARVLPLQVLGLPSIIQVKQIRGRQEEVRVSASGWSLNAPVCHASLLACRDMLVRE
jgi:hypothetical protein